MNALNILMIAPFAPPKNAAEAIQVGRILAEFDRCATGRLVTVTPDDRGWVQHDATLVMKPDNFDTHILKLPFHRLTNRLLMSHYLARLHVPDNMFWIIWMARRIAAALPVKPDIIYSRSYPLSAALLARRLKRLLGIPWVLHLSDPWAENPYARPNNRAEAQEADCFQQADLITLTTQSQAAHYQKKYPQFAQKIIVSPNVMPPENSTPPVSVVAPDDIMHIVFAGNFYGDRSPQPLVTAIDILRATRPELLKKLRISIYGHAQNEARAWLIRAPEVINCHGAVSFAAAFAAQQAADIVLSIEPQMNHLLGTSFLPSKVVDCLAMGKPLLAITPEGSETAKICREGYGWAVDPSQPALLASLIAELIVTLPQWRGSPYPAPPARYAAQTVVQALLMHMNQLRQKRDL